MFSNKQLENEYRSVEFLLRDERFSRHVRWLAKQGFDVSEVRAGRKPGTRVFTVRSETHGVATLCLEPAQERKAPAVDGETAGAS